MIFEDAEGQEDAEEDAIKALRVDAGSGKTRTVIVLYRDLLILRILSGLAFGNAQHLSLQLGSPPVVITGLDSGSSPVMTRGGQMILPQ